MSLRSDGNFTQLKESLCRVANSRHLSWLLLCTFFWIVAAASFSGFVGKWGLRDGESRAGIEAMLNKTADKPFIFRQLAPMVANYVDSVAPQQIKEGTLIINPLKTFSRETMGSGLTFQHSQNNVVGFGILFRPLLQPRFAC